MPHRAMLVRALPMLCAAANLAAQSFVEPVRTAFDVAPVGELCGAIDFDGDGDQDLLFDDGADLYAYTNDGAGAFTLAATSALTLLGDVAADAVGDYDGDGDLDFFAGSTAYENLGGGQFAADPGSSVVAFGEPPVFWDFDADGDLDLLVAANGLKLYANDGSGQFVDVTTIVLPGFDLSVSAFRAADIDGDGDTDLVKVGGGFFAPASVQVWINLGSGQLQVDDVATTPSNLVFAKLWITDFDGDLQPDIVAWAGGPPTSQPAFVVSRSTGAWVSQPLVLDAPYDAWLEADATDWDGDGLTDFVMADGVHRQVAPLQFSLEPFDTPLDVHELRAVDLDGDGDEDLALFGQRQLLWNTGLGPKLSEQAFVDGPVWRYFDARRGGSATPLLEVLVASYSYLGFGTDRPVEPYESGRTLRIEDLALTTFPLDDAVFVESGVAGQPADIVGCNALGTIAAAWQAGGYVAAPSPSATGASQIEAADLDGAPGDELVLAGPDLDGVEILTRVGGVWQDVSPSVPTATPFQDPMFEQLLVADMNGDGRADIVNEHRVLENGTGSWTVVAEYGPMLVGYAYHMVDIDRDGNGYRDLFISDGAGGLFLENVGAGFFDLTQVVLPAGIGSVFSATSADVDRDGDEDLLLNIGGTSSSVLRNDGGIFQLVPSVAPGGVFVDANHDGYPDVLADGRVFFNERNLLTSSGLALSGRDWSLELATWRVGAPAQFASIAIGLVETYVELPGIGALFLDPAFADLSLQLIVGDAATRTVTIPTDPGVIGTALFAQAVVFDGDGLELSSVVRDFVR